MNSSRLSRNMQSFRSSAFRCARIDRICLFSTSSGIGVKSVDEYLPECKSSHPEDFAVHWAAVAKAKHDEMQRSHQSLERLSNDAIERDYARRKRIIYRSKQRGLLEADLLIGSWAAENVPKMTAAELDEMEVLLAEETLDVFNYLSGKQDLPSQLENLSVVRRIRDYSKTGDMASPAGYAAAKRAKNLP